jgi:hypothetical protein
MRARAASAFVSATGSVADRPRVALLSEYFPPHAPGGAEWSAEALARALAAGGHHVVVITPNYGAPSRETRDGFSVIRFPFPIKRAPGRATVPARYLSNPLFYLYAGLAVARAARRERVELLHVQNKQMLIPGVIARALLGVPVVQSVRDASIIDAAPMCLLHGDRMPPDCGVRKLWRECAVEYGRLYGGGRRRALGKLAFLYFWLDARLKQRFLRRVDAVAGVSRGIVDVYRRFGLLAGVARVRDVPTIPPLGDQPAAEAVEATRRRLGLDGKRVVLYVGKFFARQGHGRSRGGRAARRARDARCALRLRGRGRARGRGLAVPRARPAAESRGARALSGGGCRRGALGDPRFVEPRDPRGDGRRAPRRRHARRRHAGAGLARGDGPARRARRHPRAERSQHQPPPPAVAPPVGRVKLT